MNGWFIAILFLYAVELGINMAKHGEPRKHNHSFWYSLIDAGLVIWFAYMAVVTGF
jgi:hypothetical protein